VAHCAAFTSVRFVVKKKPQSTKRNKHKSAKAFLLYKSTAQRLKNKTSFKDGNLNTAGTSKILS
jgi:hypothetical protein